MNKLLPVIYSLSTLPYHTKNPHGAFALDRVELYTAAISSLIRRAEGNVTIMHCDRAGAECLRQKGLTNLWNDVEITIPDDLGGINPLMFWAAGKLYALQATAAPLLMLDTDFIARKLPKTLGGTASKNTVIAAHREDLAPHIYPDISHFDMNEDYRFNKQLDYTIRPLNTAFLYMNNDDFKRYYVDCAMEFMKSAKPGGDRLTYMVYAEQRLLAMLADYKKVEVETLLEYEQLQIKPQKYYTHLWGAKQVMRDNPREHERICQQCRARIRASFPDWEWVIVHIDNE